MTTPQADPASVSVSAEPEACLHFHALFLDTRLDIVLSPGLGRRMRAGLARLVTGGGDGPKADGASVVPEEARVFEEKGTAR
ncbi:hypothetical protein [Streptomyces sp. V4I2]|uniref:hypothetical protein n=1 Tax=Streptomyces sp. V4I2 TaxID=3042280 RepID=UPI0027898CBB|nr:hypothetical protein [Streptomyces sp. V4I2]MDQ1050937.1 hypothetical protein [Streptomyces sp. V4I2]